MYYSRVPCCAEDFLHTKEHRSRRLIVFVQNQTYLKTDDQWPRLSWRQATNRDPRPILLRPRNSLKNLRVYYYGRPL
jgi:hypothetical protein